MNLTGTIYWGAVSQNSEFFLFLQLEIFPLILEKTYFFAIGNMTLNWSSKCAKKPCLVYQKYQESIYICITIHTLDRFTLQDKEFFWSKLLPDSLNRMNTHALIIFKCLPDPNKYKSYMIQISYKHMTPCLGCSLRWFF